ncbi:hypothetical protein BSIN_4267 [Burkholderia singularis]|uniref:Uncharacterized protein n=1 Tax=Burkholderia singularis TaxID=1503053 RepID=A0A238H814_9BURK|nr:hypothetical protein BSIN_4267 [Burkholderia singularis]
MSQFVTYLRAFFDNRLPVERGSMTGLLDGIAGRLKRKNSFCASVGRFRHVMLSSIAVR